MEQIVAYGELTLGIVTPSYNQGAFIERTIHSVLSQGIKNLDYWVIDGASTDNTLALLSQYQEKGVKFISEADKGQGQAVNKGITRLNTDIIGWINADDIYLPNALKKVVDYFSTHPYCDILFSNSYYIDEKNRVLNTYRTGKWTSEALKKRCTISQPTVFFRKSLWQRVGPLNEALRYCLDYEYWIRTAKNGIKPVFLKDFLAATRLHIETKTATGGVSSRLEAMDMLSKQYGSLHPLWYFAYARSCLLDKSKIVRAMPLLYLAMQEVTKKEGKIKGLTRLFSLGLLSLIGELFSRTLHAIRDNYRQYNRVL